MAKIKVGRYPYHPNDAQVYGIIINCFAINFELFRFYLTIERSQNHGV
jgi:hypothetical protein